MSLMGHEHELVRVILDGVCNRSMHTQAATLEREVSWIYRVFVEMTTAKEHNALTFIILRHDGTWEMMARLSVST